MIPSPPVAAHAQRAAALFGTLALIWAVSLYGLYVDERLVFALALVPRRVAGLPGILSAPLVHGSFAHLLANTFPLLILGGMVVIRGGAYYLTTTFPVVVLGGLGLWLLGRDAAHMVAYGRMIAGVLPRDDQVSWEAHLFGLIAGGLCARAALGRAR